MAPSATFDNTNSQTTLQPLKTGVQSSRVNVPTKTSENGTSGLAPLDASKITVTPNLSSRHVPEPDSAEVWGQKVVVDHMVTVPWNNTTGWSNPSLQPYGPFSLMPTASVLHYGTECFEGMKAYRGYDGKLRLFRPEMNCQRMLRSATRIALPSFDPLELQKLIEKLVAVDGPRWLAKERGGSFLYLRPAMIATNAAIGVQKPVEALLFIVGVLMPPLDDASKVPPGAGALAPKSPNAGMKLLSSSADMIRAWPGGFGNAKVGGNYGPTLAAQQEAKDRGFDQILWLFGEDGQITEAGASNFFVVWRTQEGRLELVTAPLDDGIILPGITRDSVLGIARQRLSTVDGADGLEPLEVVERNFTMNEVAKAADEGRLVEAFATGTAYFIAPVSDIEFRGKDVRLPLASGVKPAYALRVKQWLKDIMYGNVEHEWGVVVEEENVSASQTPVGNPSSALERALQAL